MITSAQEAYLSALDRLEEKNEPISLNKVAVEAGKKPGSLRPARYPEVCKAVQRVIDKREALKNTKVKNKNIKDKVEDLEILTREYKAKYHVALNRLLILENQLFEESMKTKRPKKDG